MKKQTILCLIVFLISLFPVCSQAQITDNLVSWEDVRATYYYPLETNRLIFQFDVNPQGQQDCVKTVAIQNSSSAPLTYILGYKLWQDNGDRIFQESFKETLLGSGTINTNASSIYWDGLSACISQTTRFYITIDTNTNAAITLNKTLDYKLISSDANNDGKFDFNNDLGVFMSSGKVGPAASQVYETNSLVISSSTADQSAPMGIIDLPTSGQTISVQDITISGRAKDQGGSGIGSMQLDINGTLVNTDSSDAYEHWQYQMKNSQAGDYIIKLIITDNFGNKNSMADSISFRVNTEANSIVSSEKSAITMIPSSVPADNASQSEITVTMKDQYDKTLSNVTVSLASNRGVYDTITTVHGVTDVDGKATFKVKSSQVGTSALTATCNGVKIGPVNLVFTQAVSGVKSGDLIKASGAAVYYLGADGKRYVFPNEKTYKTWYTDFSGVKTITDSQLASIMIGGNVTYRPGVKMVKITTDPKVYAVAAGGVLKWISSETVAVDLYGDNWSDLIDDIPDPFFVNYKVGDPIGGIGIYNPTNEKNNVISINVDKGL